MGIEAQTLHFCHFYGHFFEVGQVCGAATRTTARSKCAAHFRVVAFVDLTKFDTNFEYRRKHAHKFSEIHSAFRREVEDELRAVKGIFCVHKLHVYVHFRHFFTDDFERVFLVLKVFFNAFYVLFGGFAHDGFQGLDDFVFAYFLVCDCACCVFLSARGFHNHAVALFKSEVFGIEIIHLVGVSEFYAYYYCHLCFASNIEKSKSSTVAITLTLSDSLRRATFILNRISASARSE